LLDSSGIEVARALSDGDGRFTLRALSAGHYWMRSERIGFRAFVSDTVDLAAEESLEYTLHVEALPIRLETLVVPGRDRCNTNPEQGEQTVVIWDEIRKALAASVWVDEQELFHFRRYMYRRDLNKRRNRKLAEVGATRAGVAEPPYRSVPPEQLASDGYIAEREDGTWYYLPDAHTLRDEDFLDTYCFHVTRDERRRPGQIGLAFEPMSDRELPDVQGAIWLDEESSELRELEVRHTKVPYHVDDARIGGTVRFLMLPSGAWIVRDWQVRTPRIEITEHPRHARGYEAEVKGFTDTGGEIFEVSTSEGASVYSAPVSTIRGHVYDSTSAAYLRGAIATLVGTDFGAVTDDSGRFELTVPLEGEYSLAINHPRLDSLLAPSQVEAMELRRGATTRIEFQIPHVLTSMRRICGSAILDSGSRMVFGVVRESGSGESAGGVTVHAKWQDFRVWGTGVGRPRTSGRDNSRGSGTGLSVSVRDVSEHVATDGSGFYAVCGVPAGRPISLYAENDGGRSREASLLFSEELDDGVLFSWDRPAGAFHDRVYDLSLRAWKVDLTVGYPHLDSEDPATTVLYGVVSDSLSGKPIEGVTVIFNGSRITTTNADGRYEITDVVLREIGDRIEFRRVGYKAESIDLQVETSDQEIMLDVRLSQSDEPDREIK